MQMEYTEAPRLPKWTETISHSYTKLSLNPIYARLAILLGLPVHLAAYIVYQVRRRDDNVQAARDLVTQELLASGYKEKLQADFEDQLRCKHRFFGENIDNLQFNRQVHKLTEEQFRQAVHEHTIKMLDQRLHRRTTYSGTFQALLRHPLFLILTLLPGFPMYLLVLLYYNAYLKYIFERLMMSLLVIIGVSIVVFTILKLSPFHPAVNILGETATAEQIEAFNKMHGLDQPFFVQLWDTLRGIATFDLGSSFAGNEEVSTAIAAKFPITLTLTIISLALALLIALPIGIISATRPNTLFDYTFIFIALLGLSIPNFWQGLIFILNFSIHLKWLPATYNPNNWLSVIMPVIVLGTGLTASVARMTRASSLEVIHEDYIVTARAKGLRNRQVLLRHAVRNALIPILTVVGLQFGAMLGGAAVTEKVFNISGIGSYIIDKQFIPDIPAIMGGVVYTAITISLVNLAVDIMYAFIDPRIRTKMKQY
ncbi:binding-protein-dependent transport systems inner membrane component [Paenibacillus alvei TS-15]|uniref:Binding-protein-dependent transport systems inner membrane component n=2 Tax=Paenibacillus alvei TaxID=44250 RepID=S9U164_PAEAL|nr:binding-protein-dependent transport systems inner membrane component [Paenibacillus alvei TS-15]